MRLELVFQVSANGFAISDTEKTWLCVLRLRSREAGRFLLQQLDCERFRHVLFRSKTRLHVNLARRAWRELPAPVPQGGRAKRLDGFQLLAVEGFHCAFNLLRLTVKISNRKPDPKIRRLDSESAEPCLTERVGSSGQLPTPRRSTSLLWRFGPTPHGKVQDSCVPIRVEG